MSQIRSKNTEPEMIVRRYLFGQGFRYRLHDKKLPGKPDIVFPGKKKVIFIHGCFWHGHEGCKYFITPKTRTSWWLEKIEGNKQRDQNNITKLLSSGWKIFTIFECELKPEVRENTLKQAMEFLSSY
jgi:DNA mismatch endonuclease (patch repair protein)